MLLLLELCHKKICLRGLRPGHTQTGLYNYSKIYSGLKIRIKEIEGLHCVGKTKNMGTHLLTAIIDASWKVNVYYNGVCMRRGDCYVCVIHFLCPFQDASIIAVNRCHRWVPVKKTNYKTDFCQRAVHTNIPSYLLEIN